MKSLTIIPAALAFAGLCCAASAQPASPHQAPELGGAASSSLEQTAATDAAAQPAPPPPRPMADVPPPPPPPPGGPRADRAPPPHGPSIRVERDAGGTLRLDVHCGDADSAKSCADTTLAIFDKVNAVASTAK